jgi:hypothetical protein
VLGAVVVFALLLATIGVWVARDGDDVVPVDRRDEETVPTPLDAEPATPAELREAIDEISAFVADERGLEFTGPVDVELADDDEFEQRLLDDFDDEAEDLRETEVFLEAVGLVEPHIDLVDAMRALLGGGVVGFYDPETNELVVRGAALTPYVRTTMAHELTHALDDQHFDLDRPEYDDADDEIGFGFSAVVEGNARRVEEAYRSSFTEEERRLAAEEELVLAGDMDVGEIPAVLFDMIGAPYSLGEMFVHDLFREGGQEALDAALADPPRTSQQVIDPDAYRSGDERIEVTPPDVSGEVVSDGVAGQLLLVLVLAEHLGIGEARAAVDGWGGDWAVAWQDGDRSCVTLAAVGDTPADTDEMRAAFDTWAEAYGEAQVNADGMGEPFTVESCAPA